MQRRSLHVNGVAEHARRAFYDTGDVPPELLAEPLRRSWRRSAGSGIDSRRAIDFDPVTRADLRAVLERNQALLRAGDGIIEQLTRTVSHTRWLVLLLDADGVIASACNDSSRLSRELRLLARPGVDLSERRIGTNGPGTALIEGLPVMVTADQHFIESNGIYTCAAAPIRDPYGKLVGCVDLSSHHLDEDWKFDPLHLATQSANLIEERMFLALDDHLVIRLASHGGLFGHCPEAMLAVDGAGRVKGCNDEAAILFGMRREQLCTCDVTTLFDIPGLAPLLSLSDAPDRSQPLVLCNDLIVQARVQAPRGSRPVQKNTAQTMVAGAAGPCGGAAPALSLDEQGVGHALFADEISRALLAHEHDINILLQGETGTGKEVLARALHRSGPRHLGPFVAINCAAIPETLIETELFGYVDGAYTGARRGGAPGKIESAHRGVLFLDEIGDMPLPLQSRLLRVLEDRSVTRVGGHQSIPVDIAIIAASHCVIDGMVHAGTFRADLYYRLNGLTVCLPPLRERTGFVDLVLRTLQRVAPVTPTPRISRDAMDVLSKYHWPGNLRELSAVLRAAAVFARSGCIEPEHLPSRLLERTASHAPQRGANQHPATDGPSCRSLREVERDMISRAVAEYGGNMAATARALGISRGTLYRKLREAKASDS